ncbi:hypothetical protein MNBD_ALPHA11-1541, partial [hydrothermal vent metagenome]
RQWVLEDCGMAISSAAMVVLSLERVSENIKRSFASAVTCCHGVWPAIAAGEKIKNAINIINARIGQV